MTVSTANIPVLHSVEVAHLYPQVMVPICQGIATSHTPHPELWIMASIGCGKEEYNKERLHPELWILIPLAIQLDL
jgi:hypothetical protein